MIYSKNFTETDLEFLLSKFDASEVFFSFINEEFEPQVVEVAKKIDPSLMIFAAILPTISKENLMVGLKSLMEESGEVVALLGSNYKSFNFGRDDLVDDEVLKAFIQRHPLSNLAFQILSVGKFSDKFIVRMADTYADMFKVQRIPQSMLGLVRISFNNSTTEEGREELFNVLSGLETDMEAMIFNNTMMDEEEFLKFYYEVPDRLKHESLVNPACPEEIRDSYLAEGEWEKIEKLALATNLTTAQCERYTELLLAGLASEPTNPDVRESFQKTLDNFLGNRNNHIRFLCEIVSYEHMTAKKEIHSSILIAIAGRIHEDVDLYEVAQEIMNSYDLTPQEATEVLRTANSDEPSVPTDLMLHVNNILSFFYSLLRNVQAPASILETVTLQNSVANEAISLTMLPHPNLGDVQAAGILEKTVGSPFEQLTLLHLRNPEVMKLVEYHYDDLRTNSKLAIVMNPKVDGETYLALALLEEDQFIRELLMRAGGDAHIDRMIGGLFLTPMDMRSKLEAWKGSGGDLSGAKVSYAEFNLKP